MIKQNKMERVLEYPKIECPCCHCVYTFDKDDIKQKEKFRTITDYGKRTYDLEYYVTCPICDKITVLKTEKFEKNY